jgi:DNA-binding transcriptional MerR regulator
MKNSLSISDASIQTGLSQKMLREYEAKGFINEPIKIRCGSISYRRFSKEHIEEIKVFAKYKCAGFRLPVASHKAFEEIERGKP